MAPVWTGEKLKFIPYCDSFVGLNPGYDVAIVRNVTMLMSNGTRLHGAVHVFRRQGNDRLSDFARAQDAFQYLEAEHATYIINVRHLVELAEEPTAS